ncbi:MAG TPA: SPOR domain-containing protein [Anaerovoracaceae bacterium]|nr:SPOR domain-containing protein [Anaerovoracaceae bacterium]
MNRRRIRRYKRGQKNSGMKFVAFIGIMIVAIVLGYITARFLVAPAIGYDTDMLKLETLIQENPGTEDSGTEDSGTEDPGTEDPGTEDPADEEVPGGYALQFGAFSTKSAAEKLAAELDKLGIETKIVEKDDQYKVMSEILKTKSDAIQKLKDIQDDKITDVFITKIE